MKPSMYLVPTEAPGRLFLLPKPSGEWLREDVAHIRDMGVDTLVSLLEPAEEAELSLEDEGAVCAEAGIDFLRSPIPDRGLPSEAAFTALAHEIIRRLQAGQGVGVHCRAGIGRSGMVVCGALAGFGHPAAEAVARVSAARGVAVPDTPEQRAFLERMAPRLG